MSDGNIGPKIVLEGEKEYKKAISDINREQKVLTSEMKKVSAEFDGNANSIDALIKKQDVLNKHYTEQEKKIAKMREAMESASKVYGENSRQVQDWQIKLNNADAQLSKLDKELQANGKYLDEAKTSTNKTATSIDEYGKEVKEASKETLEFGDVLKANLASDVIISGVKALGSAMKSAAEGTVDLATNAAAYADDMITMAVQTGMSTDTLQAYNYMAELTDVSMETLTKSMAKNIKAMDGADRGTKATVDAYKALNVEWEDGNGHLRDSETVYWEAIDALGKLTNETKRDTIAMQLFGKSAQDLNPLIAVGSKGIADFAAEAKKMGAVLDEDTLGSLGETDDALQRLAQASEIVKRQFGTAMAPAITRAADKITQKVSEMDDGFADFAGGALDSAISGLEWVADNSPTIISGLSGIATGMAVFKAGSAVQSGIELVNKSWKAYKVATDGATISQYALNLAQSLNPMGMLAVAIGAVTGGLLLYNATMNDSEDRTKAFSELLEKSATANEEFNKSISDGIQARKENVANLDAEYGAVKKLSDELYELADKENLSNSEKQVMVALVDELNKAMPELNLSFDKETGLLSKQKTEVDGLITANLKLQKVKAAQEDMTRIANEQYEAEKVLTRQQEQRSKLLEGIAKKEALYNEILNDRDSSTTVAEERKRLASAATLRGEIDNLNLALKGNGEQISATQGNYNALGTEWEQALAYIGESTAIDDSTGALKKFGDTAENSTIQVTESNKEQIESLEILAKEYNDSLAAIEGNIRGQMKLFDEFDDSIEMSSGQMIKNLQSQVNGVKNWSENIRELAKKGIDEGLLQELYDMGPEAAGYIQVLNEMSEKELDEFNGLWVEMGKEVRKSAVGAMADTRRETVNEITKLKEELYTQGQLSARGFAEGFTSGKNEIMTAVEVSMMGAVNKGNQVLEIRSPSRKFDKMGDFSAEGYGNGFIRRMNRVKEEIGKSMPTNGDFETGTSRTSSSSTQSLTDAIMPMLNDIRVEVVVTPDKEGIFKSVKTESIKYTKRTSKPAFS